MSDKIINSWEKIGTLTKKEKALFESNFSCKAALDKLVKELITHWEYKETQARELWDAVAKKYDPNGLNEYGEHTFDYKIHRGMVFKRKKEIGKIEAFISNIEDLDKIKESVMKTFGLKETK